MKIAYFNCFSGAGGDMILGSLLDAGLELDRLIQAISGLNLDHFSLDMENVVKGSIGGTRALISIDQEHHSHHHRKLNDICQIITGSKLSETVQEKSLSVFHRLARAEARVHRKSVSEIHFHEVGAMDTIIDVVGAVAGLEILGVEEIYCSPLNLGSGLLKCAHGTLPVPAPATAELVKGKPVYAKGEEGELLTPTAAAILTVLSKDFGNMPAMIIDQVGYGAGLHETRVPNLLRVFIGQAAEEISASNEAVHLSRHAHHEHTREKKSVNNCTQDESRV